jgi:hypothetical protein
MSEASEETRQAGPDLDADVEEAFFGAVGRTEPRRFSTDVEPAIVILDKLHAEGWFWRLDSVPKGYICTVQCLVPGGKDPKNPERRTYQVGAKTLPLSICLAALKTR